MIVGGVVDVVMVVIVIIIVVVVWSEIYVNVLKISFHVIVD